MIDVDDERTWPPELRSWVYDRVALAAGSSDLPSGLRVRLVEEEESLRSLMRGRKVLAFHCSRLLPHEVVSIRDSGLQPLNRELVEQRIASAFESQFIDRAQRDQIRASTVFAIGDEENREGQVCLSLGRSALDDASGCGLLLGTWGGEGIYWASVDDAPAWSDIGTPTVVAVQLDVAVSRDMCMLHPSFGELLVQLALGMRPMHADVFYRAAVRPADIVGIWQPGDEEYDRHAHLPR